jgi:predicted DNA-binding transcriptional regulator YafY
MELDASKPASRLLGLLEILQDKPGINGPALSEMLGVTTRTVRRYVATLQDMGIPVEPVAGRTGGYWLRPGYRLPPLMFSTEEAIGLSIALLMAQASKDEELPQPVVRALAKIARVLPSTLSEQIDAIREAMSLPGSRYPRTDEFPIPAVLATLSQATLTHHSVWFRYGRPNGEESARKVDPYGVVVINGRWYLHGWCHLRKGTRTFRIDRIRRVDLLPEGFELPAGTDAVRAVTASLAMSRDRWEIEIILGAPPEEVQHWLASHFAILETMPDGRTLLKSGSDDLQWFAWRVLTLPFTIEVVKPLELRRTMREMGERLIENSQYTSNALTAV